MPLVDYSDSDDESNGLPAESQSPGAANALKRKRTEATAPSELPPLPSTFHDLYTTDTRRSTRDDSSLHGGRKRAIPHKEGNWITHVYLEWHPNPTESESLSKLITLVHTAGTLPSPSVSTSSKVQSSLLSALGTPLPLHISLSRSLVLLAPQRDRFLAALTTRIRRVPARPFDIEADSLKWVPNYERTRWFLVLGLARPANNELNKLLDACNSAAVEFGQPELYSGKAVDKNIEAENEELNMREGGKKRRFSGMRAESPGDHPDAKIQEISQTRRHSSAISVDIAQDLLDCDPQTRIENRRRLHSKDGKRPIAASTVTPQDRSEAFHISIAWTLEDPGTVHTDLLRSPAVEDFMKKEVRAMRVRFESVKVKIGNAVSVLPLNRKVGDSHGILGL